MTTILFSVEDFLDVYLDIEEGLAMDYSFTVKAKNKNYVYISFFGIAWNIPHKKRHATFSEMIV